MEEKSYKEQLHTINTFIFDIDGVLTDGTVMVTTSGEMLRRMNIKDGFALKTAVDKGFNVCTISGGSNEGVRKRLEGLGVQDVYLGAHNKIDQLKDYMSKKDIRLGARSIHAAFIHDGLTDIRRAPVRAVFSAKLLGHVRSSYWETNS